MSDTVSSLDSLVQGPAFRCRFSEEMLSCPCDVLALFETCWLSSRGRKTACTTATSAKPRRSITDLKSPNHEDAPSPLLSAARTPPHRVTGPSASLWRRDDRLVGGSDDVWRTTGGGRNRDRAHKATSPLSTMPTSNTTRTTYEGCWCRSYTRAPTPFSGRAFGRRVLYFRHSVGNKLLPGLCDIDPCDEPLVAGQAGAGLSRGGRGGTSHPKGEWTFCSLRPLSPLCSSSGAHDPSVATAMLGRCLAGAHVVHRSAPRGDRVESRDKPR